MVTKNAIGSNIPIEIAKGGTNATSMATTDGVCYFDGTSIVTTSAGTTKQVLTSNGAGVAPTYQSGALSSTWSLISTQNPSGAAQVEFKDLVSSSYYWINFSVVPGTNDRDLWSEVSIDNGSTYITSSYRSGIQYFDYNSATVNNLNDTAKILVISPGMSSSRTQTGDFYFSTFSFTPCNGRCVRSSSGSLEDIFVLANYNASDIVNAIRFYGESSATLTGRFSLYKLLTT